MVGATLFALAGCAQTDEQQPRVATLQSGSAATPQPGSGRADGAGPQDKPGQFRLRLDMSEQEKQKLQAVWYSCLAEHDPAAVNAQRSGAQGVGINVEAVSKAASEACALKFPKPPWEQDSGNPTCADNFHKQVKCINDKGAGRGLKIIEGQVGDWTFAESTTMPEEQSNQIVKDCEREVFGGGR